MITSTYILRTSLLSSSSSSSCLLPLSSIVSALFTSYNTTNRNEDSFLNLLHCTTVQILPSNTPFPLQNHSLPKTPLPHSPSPSFFPPVHLFTINTIHDTQYTTHTKHNVTGVPGVPGLFYFSFSPFHNVSTSFFLSYCLRPRKLQLTGHVYSLSCLFTKLCEEYLIPCLSINDLFTFQGRD